MNQLNSPSEYKLFLCGKQDSEKLGDHLVARFSLRQDEYIHIYIIFDTVV